MEAQEIFNKVWDHLNKQGRPARVRGGCLYRMDDGKACGIGCLVDDDTAARWDSLPNGSIVSIIDKGYAPDFLRENEELARDIQAAHDYIPDTEWLSLWRIEMATIALRHNLTVPAIPQ